MNNINQNQNLSSDSNDEFEIGEKDKMQMKNAILSRIFFELVEELDDQGRLEYLKLIEEKVDSVKLENFLKEKIKDYDFLVEKNINEFEKEFELLTGNE